MLISCRTSTSDDAITKRRLRQQINDLQDYNSGNVTNQLQAMTPEYRESLARQILESLNEETLLKLTQEPRFKELLKKNAESSRVAMNKILEDLKTKETDTFGPLRISVSRKFGLRFSKRLALKDPFVHYQVKTVHRKLACNELSETSSYWDDFLALQSSEHVLLGASPALFERFTKSCLLFYRLRASMETCQDSHLEDLNKLCQFEDQVQEEEVVD